MSFIKLVTAALLTLTLSVPAGAQTLDPNRTPPHLDPNRTANGLALTPPMGWNSWNKFGCNINEKLDPRSRRRDGRLGHARCRLPICRHRRLLARSSATRTATSSPIRSAFRRG